MRRELFVVLGLGIFVSISCNSTLSGGAAHDGSVTDSAPVYFGDGPIPDGWRAPDVHGPDSSTAEGDGPRSDASVKGDGQSSSPDQGVAPVSCTYFVDNGAAAANDSTSKGENSATKPWKTIQHAAEVLAAGETVCIKQGTYKEQVKPAASGSAGKYITYAAYPGHTVIIDGSGVNVGEWGGQFWIQNQSYIRVSGLQVKNVGSGSDIAGFYVGASQHIIIEKCATFNTSSSGIGIWTSSDILVDGNDIQQAVNGGSQECITIADSQNYEVKNNTVHNGSNGQQGGEGIDSKGACANGKVHHNRIYDIPKLCLYVDAWDKALHDIEVYSNTVTDCPNAIVLAAEMGGSAQNISFYNNVVSKAASPAIMITDWDFSGNGEGAKSNISIVNNTVYGGSDIAIWMASGTARNVVINNNLMSQNGWSELVVNSASAAQVSINNNLFDGSTSVEGNAAVQGSPKFVNASGGDFHLQAGSAAIDKGTATGAPRVDIEGTSRPKGAAVDIGAYEY